MTATFTNFTEMYNSIVVNKIDFLQNRPIMKQESVKLHINTVPETTLTFVSYDDFMLFITQDPHVIHDFNHHLLTYPLQIEYQ